MGAKIVGTRKLLATPRIEAWKIFWGFGALVGRESTTIPCILMTLEVGGFVDIFPSRLKATRTLVF
jgi:hypothetical protein